MTCHLFLDNFLRFYDLWVVFKGFKSFETDFVSRKLKYLNLVSWNVRFFWILSFVKDVFIAENWLCFRACNSRIVTCDQEFCHVEWFFFLSFKSLITESFPLKSFPKGIMVLSKTCIRFRNRIFKKIWISLIKLSFSCDLLGKRFSIRRYGKKFGNFPFWALTFFCTRKLNFGIWKGDFLSRGPSKRC